MIGIVGEGPAVEAVEVALADVDADAARTDVATLGAADFGVVVGRAGGDVFRRANVAALDAGMPWLAVAVGGVGGHALPGVEASVAGFAPTTGCYACLTARVAANADEATDEPNADRSAVRFAGAVAGREAARLVAGEESPVIGGVVEIPHARRGFLPVPGCEACADARDRTLDREYADAPLEDAVARAERAVDERAGIVRTVGELASYPAPYYLANVCDTTGFSDVQSAQQAAGVADDWNEAFMKALGEALERYSAGVYREAAFAAAPPTERDDAVPPDRFVRPSGFPDPEPDDPLPWVPGEDLATGERVSLPAEFVHFPPTAASYKPSITTGLGLGNSTVEALLSGLYEVIERDATMLAWYSTFEPLGVAVEDETFATLEKRARSEGLSVTSMLVTQDVDVPVVAVAVHRDGDWPRFAVGSGAALDPDAAATGALAEALQNWMELRSMDPDEAADADGAIGRYADFPPAAREFVAVDGRVPSERVGPDEVPAGEAELDAVVERAAAADLDVYAARLTPRDVEALGFEAVRVLVPAAQPLFTREPFFGDRARSVPRELGFEPRLDRDHHPYP